MIEIKPGDVVLFMPNGLYFRCENSKQAKWMNENPSYEWAPRDTVPDSYFYKNR